MTMTNAELQAAIVDIQNDVELLPTITDTDTLTELINTRHTTLMTAISALSDRVDAVEQRWIVHNINHPTG